MTKRGYGITSKDSGGSGAPGPQGPKGDTGAIGPSGAMGTTGQNGLQGVAGAAGPQGPIGPSGSVGATGASGAKGDTGATGPQGPTGLVGAIGPTGPIGSTGPAGLDGKRIDTYSDTTDANGLFKVVYTTAFPAIPSVQPEPPTVSNQTWVKVTSTTTGFSMRLVQRASINLLSTDLLLAAVTNVSGASAKAIVVAA